MSDRWLRKRSLEAKAQVMRGAKRLREHEAEDQVVDVGSQQSGTVAELNHYQFEYGDDSELELDPEEDVMDPQEVFDDWMLTLAKDQRMMLSVLLYDNFCKRQNMGKMDAAREVASITGLHATCIQGFMA